MRRVLLAVLMLGLCVATSAEAQSFSRLGPGPAAAAAGGLSEVEADLLYLRLDAANGTITGDITLDASDIICAVSNTCHIGQTTRFNSITASDLFSDRIQNRSPVTRIKMAELDGTRFSGPIDSDVGAVEFDDVDGVDISAGPLALTAGPLLVAGSDPVLTAGGTSPTIVGADTAGQITIGTTVTTSCTATFAAAFTNAPSCIVTGDDAATSYAATTSTTVLTITSSADMDSDVINYFCTGL